MGKFFGAHRPRCYDIDEKSVSEKLRIRSSTPDAGEVPCFHGLFDEGFPTGFLSYVDR